MKKWILALVSFCFFTVSGNAIEVAFEKDSRLPIVYLNLAVKTGAVTDPKDKQGLTRLVGQSLLRGTKSMTKEQLDLELDQIGAVLGVETRAEALILRSAVLKKNLPRFLELLADVALNPSFPTREIRKLKRKTISQILNRQSRDTSLARAKFEEFLFQEHPYGNSIAGKVSHIKRIRIDDLKKHYDYLFKDKQLLVVGSGDADPGFIEAWSQQLAQKRPGGMEKFTISQPKNSSERRLVIVDKPRRTQTQVIAGQIGVLMTNPDYHALHLANYAYGGPIFTSRLFQEVREKRGWTYVATSYYRMGTQPRSWQYWIMPDNKTVDQALKLTLEMIEKFKKEGITQEEFEFAKNSIVNNAGFNFNTPQKRVENKILERTLGLPDGFMENIGPAVKKVSLSDVNKAIKKFVRPENLSITVLATAKDVKKRLSKAAQIPEAEIKVVPWDRE